MICNFLVEDLIFYPRIHMLFKSIIGLDQTAVLTLLTSYIAIKCRGAIPGENESIECILIVTDTDFDTGTEFS